MKRPENGLKVWVFIPVLTILLIILVAISMLASGSAASDQTEGSPD
jgi:hypothetical protein